MEQAKVNGVELEYEAKASGEPVLRRLAMKTRLITRIGARRWTIVLPAVLLLTAAAGWSYAVAADAARGSAPAMDTAGPVRAAQGTMQPFEVTGLPAGRATGVPVRRTFPVGFTLKHVHGGPTYVYVLIGSLNITDADGKTVTYQAGDFFSEPAGYVHTVHVPEHAEVFILFVLPPGAEALIPVQ